uniref:Uncharacterized protein n=1 Tax=Rhizophagus irregularis (strain DAOM 181602 / DAOM 197198 / MUCL 43194) TaxID=747089 RepID=U9UA77_RHIID
MIITKIDQPYRTGLDQSGLVWSGPKKTGLSTWTGPDRDRTDLNSRNFVPMILRPLKH